ncbi:hypothetical protein D3C77_602330 [compost metagenome]
MQGQPLGQPGCGGNDGDLGGNGIRDGEGGDIAGNPLIAGTDPGAADLECFDQALLIYGGNGAIRAAPACLLRDVGRAVVAVGRDGKILSADPERGAGVGFGSGLVASGVG